MNMNRSMRSDLTSLPEYIVTNFLPGAQPLLQRYPKLFRFLGVILALWYFGPLARLQAVWTQFAQFLIATVTVASDEDLFQYLMTWIAEKDTLKTDHTLAAVTNSPSEDRRRRRHDPDFEEMARKPNEESKIKYEQSGTQIFFHKRRLFYIKRAPGDGHTYYGNRTKRSEVLSICCLGRSTQPIKDFIEDIYATNKEKERTMTIIRRPFTGGYSSRLSWSRLTAKPRRALDTVILDREQKQRVIKDIEEYMDESTQNFYADHGIPYRRGYLLHGDPGTGKTSFCLALAAKFNLDVYVLTLLDHELQDSDLMSLMNQLPSPSLLLLEDIDAAGLSRKKPFADTSGSGGMGGLDSFMSSMKKGGRKGKRSGLPEGAIASTAEGNLESDDEEGNQKATRVSLSGLLNAIDGVASPEGIVTVLTTNRPNELDDALVRAGRISVKVAFTNASKEQSEEMFLRMYVDRAHSGATSNKEVGDATVTDEVKELAKKFAEQMPEGDFSPADLQDYLLLHKKNPQGAVRQQKAWIEEKYEERKRREAEKEAEIRYKVQKAERRRRQFREDMKAALGDGKPDHPGQAEHPNTTEAELQDEDDEAKQDQPVEVDERPISAQLAEAEAEIVAEDRAHP